jgi:hypothetical protein
LIPTPNNAKTFLAPDDFEGWWNAAGEWVEEPNQARSGWSGVLRVYCGQQLFYVKKQQNYLCRSLRHPLGWPTVSREYRNLLRLHAIGLLAPKPVFHGSRKTAAGTQAILVTEELKGFVDLEQLIQVDDTKKTLLARLSGEAIGKLHRAGYRHGCLYGKHLMARWQDSDAEIAFIDLEKLRRAIFPRLAIRHDLEQLKRRQRLWNDAQWSILLESHRRILDGHQ